MESHSVDCCQNYRTDRHKVSARCLVPISDAPQMQAHRTSSPGRGRSQQLTVMDADAGRDSDGLQICTNEATSETPELLLAPKTRLGASSVIFSAQVQAMDS